MDQPSNPPAALSNLPAAPSNPPAVVPPAAAKPAGGAAPATPPAVITYDDFAKLDLRVATVLECKAHPNADKLWVLQIDLGGEKRQICAGLRQHVTAEQMVGQQIVVVANLAPRPLRGEVSHGMLLAASDASGKVILVGPKAEIAPGAQVR